MTHLLNILAAIALLVWGTHMVRTGIMQVFGSRLRAILVRGTSNRFKALLSGLGVTMVLQSSTASALIVSAFVGQRLVTLPLALAVMLGADVGTSLMAVVLSVDLSWLSPLLILTGVVMFISKLEAPAGKAGRGLIGLGLMLLALRLVSLTTTELTQSPVLSALLSSIGSDTLLKLAVGAVLAVAAYSSLAIVLLTASLTSTCPRRSRTEPPYRLNREPGVEADAEMVGCG